MSSFVCEHCKKQFMRESTLSVHMCESKRRRGEQNERGVQLGFQAFLKFYQVLHGSSRLKTVDDFIESNYYKAFVKFGRYCVDIRAVAPEQFLDWLLKNNKKIDQWCKDSFYEEYLREYLKREPANEAVDRGVKEMQNYADGTNRLADWNHYFRYGNSNRICFHITTGRVSPWILYNCNSGIEWLDSLSSEHLGMVMPYIDPDFWQTKFTKHPADVEFCKHQLKELGL